MNNQVETLNVYFYALYDAANHQPHSGLTASICADAVRSDISGNYIDPRYITIRRVPELVGIARADSSQVEIVPLGVTKGNPRGEDSPKGYRKPEARDAKRSGPQSREAEQMNRMGKNA